jgi:Tol biopolymer transport system component
MALYGDKTGSNKLYVMDLKSKHIKRLTHGELPKFVSTSPVWSRDGLRIVFILNSPPMTNSGCL